jgi:hypothetical protein
VAIHAALIPASYKIILWGRNLPLTGPKSVPEPGIGSNGGNVSTVFDVKVGTPDSTQDGGGLIGQRAGAKGPTQPPMEAGRGTMSGGQRGGSRAQLDGQGPA